MLNTKQERIELNSGHYIIHTLGCQMNVYDSDRMEEILQSHRWSQAQTDEEADLIIFNTCSVREKAEQKLRSAVGKLAALKKKNPELLIAVTGCMAQSEGERLLQQLRHVDLLIGPDNIAELPSLLLAQQGGAPPIARTVLGDKQNLPFLTTIPQKGMAPVSAFVTTMKGCNERCSFCIVPYTRGSERYRPAREILEEIHRWMEAGAKEIVLLGQTVNSYRDPSLPPPLSSDPDESQFPALLRLIAKEAPELVRLRYTSPHPRHVTPSLIQAHAELEVLAHHVHLPVQSGSNAVLRRMIRRYHREELIERAKALKNARSGMTLSTDIIVGFPGETEEDFGQTLSLVKEVEFTTLFGFKFSPRRLTPALRLKGEVPESIKSERLTRLLELIEEQGQHHLNSLVGSTTQVLIEGLSPTSAPPRNRSLDLQKREGERMTDLLFYGRSHRNELVHIPFPIHRDPIGHLVPVSITHAYKHALRGTLLPGALDLLPSSSVRNHSPTLF
ncbi:tRNA (N6-isopentenyl adenosine(37)-C2)-methylthiotransferase MiaB [Pajaroellobacter abortibovis]|uniref:tRNA-2-methylthio-N(6)-dimethylallyladenosine synthase n=1 Tax=Pajaroellobacter abortibovis TaxID=1882918 RepID=A0A1L6MX56_9BACT|nr:tRNA (N6-isopentenyl adenosine(37)-C2)-methylthiotransferase MiaB [Pajaroellobacter abortibovis]APS00102.1 tRNA (N6-isopentenyl adenosine(37)-C2)-methylthiotransferase MiaB [Pajaroellobacter abortibovis]